jgi:hypothetical protein
MNFDQKTDVPKMLKKWYFSEKSEKNVNFVKKREISDFIEKKPRRKRLCFCSGWGLYTFIANYWKLSKKTEFFDFFRGVLVVFLPARVPSPAPRRFFISKYRFLLKFIDPHEFFIKIYKNDFQIDRIYNAQINVECLPQIIQSKVILQQSIHKNRKTVRFFFFMLRHLGS